MVFIILYLLGVIVAFWLLFTMILKIDGQMTVGTLLYIGTLSICSWLTFISILIGCFAEKYWNHVIIKTKLPKNREE